MAGSSKEGGHDPLHQFEIQNWWDLQLFGVDISFTNASAFMVAALVSVCILMFGGVRKASMVPGKWQSLAESLYEFVAGVLKDTAGIEAKKFFPIVFTLFMFILMLNLLGMLPYSFTVTSHIIVTFALAFMVFVGATIVGFAKHGTKYFRMFFPEGVPAILGIIIVPIEVISYFARPVSLSIRLAANMMAGHTMLKVIAGFIGMMGVFGIAPFLFLVLLCGFELFVAFLQAFIFTILTCVYLNDALHLH